MTTSSRIVPTLVGGTRIFIECPAWCTVDHVATEEGSLEDLWHGGCYANLEVPRMGRTPDLFAFARLGIDPTSSEPQHRETFVVVDDGGQGHYMEPEQADEFADNLERFASEIRAMATTARAA